MRTLQDALNTCYAILKQPQGATAYPVDLMTQFINSAQNDICNGTVVELTQPNVVVQKQALQFLDATVFYTSAAYGNLSGNAVVGDTVLAMSDSSAFYSSGAVLVDGNVVTYTSNT